MPFSHLGRGPTFVAVACVALLAGIGVARAPIPRDLPPTAGQERTFPITKEVGITFCWIPAGECQLGSTKEEQKALEESFIRAYIAYGEKPEKARQLVAEIDPEGWKQESEATRGKFTTRGFWLGKFQVTQEQWTAVMGDDDLPFSFRKGGKNATTVAGLDTRQFPVESVTWKECVQFTEKLQKLLGRDAGVVRLPHEDEWEYACRGGKGNKTPYYFGATCNGKEGNYFGAQPFPFSTVDRGPIFQRPTAVGSYAKATPHPWGLCDMGFNVHDFCENPFAKDSESKTARGGSFSMAAWASRSAARWSVKPSDRKDDVGLRVLLVPR